MNKVEFIDKMVGVKYVNRGYSLEGCDCFGLVYLYYKHVHGADIELSDEYFNYDDFLTSFTAQLNDWEEVASPESGDCCFVSFSNGIPTHCGIMISKDKVLHANGFRENKDGQVLIWGLNVMIKLMGSDIKYYRPRGLDV